jgi:hypothetical protein
VQVASDGIEAPAKRVLASAAVNGNPALVVLEEGRRLRFEHAALLAYHGGRSPAGVAHAFKVLERALPLLDEGRAPERRELEVSTAFGGPGARDGFELVTRAVSDGRYRLDPSLARPERGVTLERFVFHLRYRAHALTLVVREGLVPDELIALARAQPRDAELESRFVAVKAHAAALVMAHPAPEVYDVIPGAPEVYTT